MTTPQEKAAAARKAAQDAARIAAEAGAALELGAILVDGAVDSGARVRIPMKTMNRHGLIAGATGTGKTKTLQGIAEQLSAAGVPVVLADVKGDLSGLAQPGASDDKLVANNPAVKSFIRSATTAAGREISRSIFGTRRR